jgi:hypothetical protein
MAAILGIREMKLGGAQFRIAQTWKQGPITKFTEIKEQWEWLKEALCLAIKQGSQSSGPSHNKKSEKEIQ